MVWSELLFHRRYALLVILSAYEGLPHYLVFTSDLYYLRGYHFDKGNPEQIFSTFSLVSYIILLGIYLSSVNIGKPSKTGSEHQNCFGTF